jgi:hypothetical protein
MNLTNTLIIFINQIARNLNNKLLKIKMHKVHNLLISFRRTSCLNFKSLSDCVCDINLASATKQQLTSGVSEGSTNTTTKNRKGHKAHE